MTKKEAPKSDAVATRPQTSGEVVSYGEEYEGEGFENVSGQDYALPFLALLQTNSPQCGPDKDKRVEAARPGHFINTVNNEVIPGEQGFIFVPCLTEHVFTEWTPRDKGGGFKGRVLLTDKIVEEARNRPTTRPGRLQTGRETELVETFYMYGMQLESADAVEPKANVVLAFTSTKIKKYRKIITRLRSCKELGKAPLFAHRLLVRSVGDKNQHGAFYNMELTPLVDDSVRASAIPPRLGDDAHPLLVAGKQLKEQIAAGILKPREETQAAPGEGGSGDDAF